MGAVVVVVVVDDASAAAVDVGVVVVDGVPVVLSLPTFTVVDVVVVAKVVLEVVVGGGGLVVVVEVVVVVVVTGLAVVGASVGLDVGDAGATKAHSRRSWGVIPSWHWRTVALPRQSRDSKSTKPGLSSSIMIQPWLRLGVSTNCWILSGSRSKMAAVSLGDSGRRIPDGVGS